MGEMYPNNNDVKYINFIRKKLLPFLKNDEGCFIFELSDDFKICINVILVKFILIFTKMSLKNLDFELVTINYCPDLKTIFFDFEEKWF